MLTDEELDKLEDRLEANEAERIELLGKLAVNDRLDGLNRFEILDVLSAENTPDYFVEFAAGLEDDPDSDSISNEAFALIKEKVRGFIKKIGWEWEDVLTYDTETVDDFVDSIFDRVSGDSA